MTGHGRENVPFNKTGKNETCFTYCPSKPKKETIVNNGRSFVRIREDTKRQNVEVKNHLNITQDTLIKQIAEKENMNVATVRRLFQATEDVVFHYLSSTAPSEELTIKLWNGIHIRRKYIKTKKYSKGMFQNIDCPEHVHTKAHLSKYYNRQINQKLFHP